ncbi:hypothetical protein ACB094_05G055600 [Castanea mollissima]
MGVVQIVFQAIVLLGSINTFVQAVDLAKPSCQANFGKIGIPYPFRVGADCFYEDWFAISCNDTFNPPKPFLRRFNLEVLEISLEGTVRVNYPTFSSCSNSITKTTEIVNLTKSPFVFSQSKNSFIAIGCNIFASMKSLDGSVIAGCMFGCGKNSTEIAGSSCIGIINCCLTPIHPYIGLFNATIEPKNISSPNFNDQVCNYAVLLERKFFNSNLRYPIKPEVHVPVVLEWGIDETLYSRMMGSEWSECGKHLTSEVFKRNGGLLLQQYLSLSEVIVEKIKLFDPKDLDKAMDHFNVNRILDQGGQGTVYKGMLTDGKIVAVKRSKLLGCCLETKFPLLVYEFIPNGTLSQYLSDQNEEFPPTWDMHLRISKEQNIFYFCKLLFMRFYHWADPLSTNILLDDKNRAKVVDFGTSRSVAIDQTQLTTTLVHGTFGYLDPKYFQTNQFTENSDVYNFGVVLVELLTGEKAVSSITTQEFKSLATYFIYSMETNSLFEIFDARIVNEYKEEQMIAVAKLAKRCLNIKGKKRPTMKEVAMELEAIQMFQ